MIGKTSYQLMQMIRNPRNESWGEMLFGVYDTWAGAKADAMTELKDCKWVIYKCTIVDTNMTARSIG